jgi:hypothetical protein
MLSPEEVVGSSMRQSNADDHLGDVPYGTKTGVGFVKAKFTLREVFFGPLHFLPDGVRRIAHAQRGSGH